MRITLNSYIVDTHALVWFISKDKKLSPLAKQVLNQAEAGEVQVLIPTLVLAELDYIAQKKRVAATLDELLGRIQEGTGFAIVPFDTEVFQAMLTLPHEWEIHDRIIASTSRYYKAILITRDEVLRNTDEIETVWD